MTTWSSASWGGWQNTRAFPPPWFFRKAGTQEPDCTSLHYRPIAIASGPTRAVSMTRFLAEYGIVPRLVIVNFDSPAREKMSSLVCPPGKVLIENGYELIVQKLKEHSIDLLVGRMLELPIAKALGIEHLHIMLGSQMTVGSAGAHNLARLLCGSGRDGNVSDKDCGT